MCKTKTKLSFQTTMKCYYHHFAVVFNFISIASISVLRYNKIKSKRLQKMH